MDVLKKALVCFTILSILILVCGCVNTQGNVQMPVKDVEKPENKENQEKETADPSEDKSKDDESAQEESNLKKKEDQAENDS